MEKMIHVKVPYEIYLLLREEAYLEERTISQHLRYLLRKEFMREVNDDEEF